MTPKLLYLLAFSGFIACDGSRPASPPPEQTVGPEVLQLRLRVSQTVLQASDLLTIRMYATNPTALAAVARVDCLHYGLGVVMRSPSGALEDVFTGIPPCKVPDLPPTLRIAPGRTDSSFYGQTSFSRGKPPGEYHLQVVFRTLDGVFAGETVVLQFQPD